MPWWLDEDLRLIQTNLRETDATADLDALVERLEWFGANAWLLNTGGVCAFYPTDLEHHRESPHLEGDLVGGAVERCRERGIRLLSRFDFSKVHEGIAAERPGWLYRDPDGEIVNYDGMVHTCVNGGYQREYAFEILEEVLSRYAIDGIFFNMFGYQEHDYDGNYHGPCHCANCRERFRELYDAALPPKGYDEDHPVYDDYREFQDRTTDELLDRVGDLVAGLDRDVAVYTYDASADVVASESNTAVDRPLPNWPHSAADNVKAVEDTWPGKRAGNICINAVDIPYRFMGVSEGEVAIRLAESLAAGGGLAFCINGVFADYPDRKNFGTVRRFYHLHREHEATFRAAESIARVALVRPVGGERREYRGAFKALTEAHVPFDAIDGRGLPERRGMLSGYDLVVLPDARRLDDATLDALAALPGGGTNVLATGRSLLATERGRGMVETLFGGEHVETRTDTRGAYVDASGDGFPRLDGTDWVVVDGPFAGIDFEGGAETALPYVTPGTFGPPERVGHEGLERTEIPGFGVRDHGTATAAHLPWMVGQLYYEHGYPEHRSILLDAVESLTVEPSPITTDAPRSVELFVGALDDGHLLGFVNLSGFDGTAFHDPEPVGEIRVEIDGADPATATSLSEEGSARVEGSTVVLDELGDYAAVVSRR